MMFAGRGRDRIFRDRAEAAQQLAAALDQWRGKRPLILAIPRGAVPMGEIIADRLGGDLDVVLTRKLRAPMNSELAIGAVDESGRAQVEEYAQSAGADADYIAREIATQLNLMRERRAQYTGAAPALDPSGRIVIVVDDGLATGSTMIAALHALRGKQPARLICAVPVAPRETVAKVAAYADEFVCLQTPEPFYAVGEFYEHFIQVEDDEVVATLKMARQKAASTASRGG
jgi:predicted phosphoribosyltransferase